MDSVLILIETFLFIDELMRQLSLGSYDSLLSAYCVAEGIIRVKASNLYVDQ